MSGRRPSPPAPPHRRSLRPRRPTGSPGPAQVRGESDSLRPSPVQTPSVSRSAASIGRRCARSTAPTAAPGSHEPPPAYRRRSTPPSGKCSGRRCNRHVATVSARWARSARRASSCSPMSSGAGIRVGRRCTPIVAEIKHTDAPAPRLSGGRHPHRPCPGPLPGPPPAAAIDTKGEPVEVLARSAAHLGHRGSRSLARLRRHPGRPAERAPRSATGDVRSGRGWRPWTCPPARRRCASRPPTTEPGR